MAARVGERYVDVAGLADPVFEVKLTPNRPDCTGVRGIARDLAAAGIGTLKPERAISGVEGADPYPTPIKLEFSKETRDAVPCSCPLRQGRGKQPVARVAAEPPQGVACALSTRSST